MPPPPSDALLRRALGSTEDVTLWEDTFACTHGRNESIQKVTLPEAPWGVRSRLCYLTRAVPADLRNDGATPWRKRSRPGGQQTRGVPPALTGRIHPLPLPDRAWRRGR